MQQTAKSDSKPKGRPPLDVRPKSEAVRVRLDHDEKAAFNALAEKLGVTASSLHRRLINEAVGAGPQVFEVELAELLDANRQLSAIGRNINQIARAINRGSVVVEPIVAEDLSSVRAAVDQQKLAVRNMIKRARSRRLVLKPIRNAQ